MTEQKGEFKRAETSLIPTKRDAGEALMAVTGYAPEILTVLKTTLPPNIAADTPMLAAYVMTCHRLNIDPLGGGVYPTNMRGRFVPILHYNTMRGVAERTGELESLTSACVYDGESIGLDFTTNTVTHTPDAAKRSGKPIGAWALVERKDGKTFLVYVARVDVERSKSEDSAWGGYSADMTEKCAVRRVLSKAFSALFAGIYTEEDVDRDRNTFVRDADTTPVVELSAADIAATAEDLFGGER